MSERGSMSVFLLAVPLSWTDVMLERMTFVHLRRARRDAWCKEGEGGEEEEGKGGMSARGEAGDCVQGKSVHSCCGWS